MIRDTPVTLAAVTGAHGVTGEVRLKLLGEGLDALKAHDSFNGGALTIGKIRSDNRGGAIARFHQVATRAEAEALRGTTLSVAREALPPLDDGEYYHADLIGLAVFTEDGDTVGHVIDVQNFGATDIVEIAKDPAPEKGMKAFMVPMTAQAVLGWNDERMTIAAEFVQ